MEYRRELKTLIPLRRLYFGQYILLFLVKLALLLLGLNALIRLAQAALPFPRGLWAILNLAAAAALAVYNYLHRPGNLQFARWLDERLDSKERFQTLFELELPSPIPKAGPEMQTLIFQETGRYLAANPPAVKIDRRLFRRWLPALLAALVICAAIFYISPALSSRISQGKELQTAQLEAEQALAELEELLSEIPLLDELTSELALLKQHLNESRDLDEVALSLQETRELLAEYAEKLDEAGQALQIPEELMASDSAAEIASALQEDPRFNQQLLDSLKDLQNSLFQLSSAEAQELREELSRIEKTEADGTDISPEEVGDLLALLEQLDPSSAQAAVQSGINKLASAAGSGKGAPGSAGEGSGEHQGNSSGAGDQEGEGSGGKQGQGGSDSAGNSGETGSGASGEGTGQQGGGSNGSSGNGSGGGQGPGAGTGGGSLFEQQFYFIPGDRQVELGGAGEDSSYTWQELLKYNPAMVPEDLSHYYDSYYHQGISSITRGQVPPPLENYLRAYFQAITPPGP